MSKVSEALTLLERSRALGLSAEVQASLDAAILAEVGIHRKSQPTAVQLDIFAAVAQKPSARVIDDEEERIAAIAAEYKRESTTRLRAMYAQWMRDDPHLREMGQCVSAAARVAGGLQELAALLGGGVSIVRTYLGGYSAPCDREARIIASLVQRPEAQVIAVCHAAAARIDELRAEQGIRRAVRRTVHFIGE